MAESQKGTFAVKVRTRIGLVGSFQHLWDLVFTVGILVEGECVQ